MSGQVAVKTVGIISAVTEVNTLESEYIKESIISCFIISKFINAAVGLADN